MSSERDVNAERNARLRARILGAAGPTCLVVAAAMVSTSTAQAADPATASVRSGDVAQQSGHVLGDGMSEGSPSASQPKQWWHNGWVRPWGNWNNWHNFAPWANWHNWGRRW
jgi:predicted secreted Zn-dependent protease